MESKRRVPVDIADGIVRGPSDPVTSPSTPGVIGTCSDCGHKTTAYGRGDASRRRVLAVMRETCPNSKGSCPQHNFYVDADDE